MELYQKYIGHDNNREDRRRVGEHVGGRALDTDLDGDGRLDAVRLDFDGDGRLDDAMADLDGDGIADHAALDLDNDGRAESYFTDADVVVRGDHRRPRGATAVVRPEQGPT